MQKKICVIALCVIGCPISAQAETKNIPAQQSPKVQEAPYSCGFNPNYAEEMLGKDVCRKTRRQHVSPTRLEPIPDNI